jgi:hypothetical protein
MKIVTAGSCAVLIALMMHGRTLDAAASCESLSSMMLPNTSITFAQLVAAGGFTLPGTGPAAVPQFSRLPTFCRAAATLTPSSDSDIKIEVWLPAASWNGKFQAIIAGAPANNQTQLCAWRPAVEAKILQEPASVVPRAKLTLVNTAVLAACDALDGVVDGLLTDPHQCHFDPGLRG